MHLSKVHKI